MMTISRNNKSYEVLIYDFTAEVEVVCPNCSKKALVKTDKFHDENAKLICIQCRYSKISNKSPAKNIKTKDYNALLQNAVVIAAGIDPYFRLPLWRTAYIGANLFWVYNMAHLNFIKDFVSAKLRERDNSEMRNKSLGSRLPKWITSSKNRALILKTIERLEKK